MLFPNIRHAIFHGKENLYYTKPCWLPSVPKIMLLLHRGPCSMLYLLIKYM